MLVGGGHPTAAAGRLRIPALPYWSNIAPASITPVSVKKDSF